jgi:hypothetical protein
MPKSGKFAQTVELGASASNLFNLIQEMGGKLLQPTTNLHVFHCVLLHYECRKKLTRVLFSTLRAKHNCFQMNPVSYVHYFKKRKHVNEIHDLSTSFKSSVIRPEKKKINLLKFLMKSHQDKCECLQRHKQQLPGMDEDRQFPGQSAAVLLISLITWLSLPHAATVMQSDLLQPVQC